VSKKRSVDQCVSSSFVTKGTFSEEGEATSPDGRTSSEPHRGRCVAAAAAAKMIRMANLDGNSRPIVPESDAESQEGTGLVWKEDVASLPPLPTPVYSEMRAEAACGCTLVLGIIGVLVGSTTASLAPGSMPSENETTRQLGLFLIYGEAAVAIICLLGLMWGDPGTVKRTKETCFPLPDAVAERLHNGQSLDGMSNIVEGDRVYCVRCLVWRPDQPPPSCVDVCNPEDEMSEGTHHCATCNRCVTDFDHHCGVRRHSPAPLLPPWEGRPAADADTMNQITLMARQMLSHRNR